MAVPVSDEDEDDISVVEGDRSTRSLAQGGRD